MYTLITNVEILCNQLTSKRISVKLCTVGVQRQLVHCISKNIPAIFSWKHCQIFIMFGTHVTEKVSKQML